MKLISRIFLLTLCVVGIFIATENIQVVEFTYVPGGAYSPLPQGAKVEMPLFLLVLAALLAGAFLAAFSTAVEHARLRAGLRRQTRIADKSREEAQSATGQLDDLKQQLEAERSRADQATDREKSAIRAREEAISASREAEMRRLEAEADSSDEDDDFGADGDDEDEENSPN